MKAPCRAALQSKTQCPKCHRPVSIKTLRYTHVCGRTWDVAERAREEEQKAQAKCAPPKSKYADLLVQINYTARGSAGEADIEMPLRKVYVPDVP